MRACSPTQRQQVGVAPNAGGPDHFSARSALPHLPSTFGDRQGPPQGQRREGSLLGGGCPLGPSDVYLLTSLGAWNVAALVASQQSGYGEARCQLAWPQPNLNFFLQ